MKLVLLISMFLIPAFWTLQDDDDDDWIDPTDMLNYDAASGKMVKQPQAAAEMTDNSLKTVQTSCPAETKECEKSLKRLKLRVEECKMKTEEKLSQSNSNPIFRRYLHKIIAEIERLGLPDESQPEVHYDAEVFLTKHMFAEIREFLNDGDWSIGALDEALSRTLINFKPHDEEKWRWKFEDYFGVDPFTLFMVLLCLLCTVCVIATEIWTRVGWYTQIMRLCILCIIISFGWNWLYLYKVAFAERQADLAKMEKYDSSCGQKITWSEGLFDWIKSSVSFQNDPCEEYFKALMINPALMVPPTKALALTFTDFITEPLKHIGKGIGEFLHALLVEIPGLLQIPVLIFLAVALLAFCYGTGSSIGHISRVRQLPGPDQNQHQAIDHQRPNPLPSVQGVDYLHNPDRYHVQQQWRDRNLMPNQLRMRPEMWEPADIGDTRALPTPIDMRQKEQLLQENKEGKKMPICENTPVGSDDASTHSVLDSTLPCVETIGDMRQKEVFLNENKEHTMPVYDSKPVSGSSATSTEPVLDLYTVPYVETTGDVSTSLKSEHQEHGLMEEKKDQSDNEMECFKSKATNHSVTNTIHRDNFLNNEESCGSF